MMPAAARTYATATRYTLRRFTSSKKPLTFIALPGDTLRHPPLNGQTKHPPRSLDAGCKHGLEMRALFFSRDYAHLNVPKSGFFQELMQLHFAEAQPVVGIKFARFFEAMTQQIENHKTTAAFQDAARRGHGALRMKGMMQRLAEHRQVDAVAGDGRLFDIA